LIRFLGNCDIILLFIFIFYYKNFINIKNIKKFLFFFFSIVSGALDRLHYLEDPCVKYDVDRKMWVYLHKDRTEDWPGKKNI
jgi:hypothetical protein